ARPDGPHPQPLLPQKGEGAPERDAGTWTGPFGFAGNWGYQEDGDSGLQLLGHRYYDPSTGRFLTRDPIKDGRNWYSYCENNPLTAVDPAGLFWKEIVGSVFGIAAAGLVGGMVVAASPLIVILAVAVFVGTASLAGGAIGATMDGTDPTPTKEDFFVAFAAPMLGPAVPWMRNPGLTQLAKESDQFISKLGFVPFLDVINLHSKCLDEGCVPTDAGGFSGSGGDPIPWPDGTIEDSIRGIYLR
ncbi:MAG: RHS repeat-associated core domain-containing protein, partial [Fimbriimonadaceae bacterium]|nr:RHS repeat-associated core domain-containing protein [Fimbriimonadaceae bacterium]